MLATMRGHGHGHTTAMASHTGGMATAAGMDRCLTVPLALWVTGWLAVQLAGWLDGWIGELCGWLRVWLCWLGFSAGMGAVVPAAFWQHAWKKATRIDENQEFVSRLVHLNGSPKSKATNEA